MKLDTTAGWTYDTLPDGGVELRIWEDSWMWDALDDAAERYPSWTIRDLWFCDDGEVLLLRNPTAV